MCISIRCLPAINYLRKKDKKEMKIDNYFKDKEEKKYRKKE